jgi:hypothetical protein
MASAVGLPANVVRLPGSNWIQPSCVYLSKRKEDSHVTDTPNRIIFNPLPLFTSLFNIPCSLFFWLTPGFEPCSPHSQCDTLPDKLKPTFVIEDRFELSSSDSNSDMLPLHHSIICGSYESRTRSL